LEKTQNSRCAGIICHSFSTEQETLAAETDLSDVVADPHPSHFITESGYLLQNHLLPLSCSKSLSPCLRSQKLPEAGNAKDYKEKTYTKTWHGKEAEAPGESPALCFAHHHTMALQGGLASLLDWAERAHTAHSFVSLSTR